MKKILAKAIENYKAAELCYDSNLFNAYGNRIYYAFFHLGCFARQSIKYQKKQHIKIIDDVRDAGYDKLAFMIHTLQSMRVEADYRLKGVTRSQIDKAKRSIDTNFKDIHKSLKGV